MSTDLGRVMPLDDRIRYSQALSQATLLPKSYQKQPANILLALEYANALGIQPMTAIQQVHVIDGKPSASAQLMASLVRRAGHRLRVTGDEKSATAEIVRADDPDFTFRVTWTLTRAQAAGVTNKGVWKNYAANMLKARAISEVARDACAEVLMGVSYTPEELGSDDPSVLDVDQPQQRTRQPYAINQEPVIDAEVIDADYDQATDEEPNLPEGLVTIEQLAEISTGLRQMDLTTRDAAAEFIIETVGRDVPSSKHLTVDEARIVLKAIRAGLATAEAEIDTGTGEIL